MEFIDVYNKNWEKTGRIIDRYDSSVTLTDEEYILVVGCWVFNSKKQILLTKRSPEKKFAPNLWENTGGHAMAGETGPEAIVRELAEETGIQAAQEEMVELGRAVKQGGLALEYVVFKDVPAEEIKLQPGETCEARWVSEEEFDHMIETGEVAPSVAESLAPFREAFDQALHRGSSLNK